MTLRFVPHRPDLAADKPKGDQSAEYLAFELCGPGEVLVIDALGWKYSSIGGDIKFFRLYQRQVGGLVTDGAVRDTNSLKQYRFRCIRRPPPPSRDRPSSGPGRSTMLSSAAECWGAPGDAIVGDDDGVVVVPRAIADEVIEIAHQREEVEEVIKAQLEVEGCSPGKVLPLQRPDLAVV